MNKITTQFPMFAAVALGLSTLFAPNANAQIYVNTTTTIAEYTTTGAFVRNVVTSGLSGAQDITFGLDGMLYAADDAAGAIKKFDPDSGAFLGNVISGLNRATNCAFGQDGSMYVSEYNANRVLRINPTTGSVLQTYTGISSALGLQFMPGGDLLAAEGGSGGNIRRINVTTGTVTSFVASTNIADVHLLLNGNYVFTDRSGSELHVTSANGGSFSNFTNGSTPGLAYFMDNTADTLYVGSAGGGVYRYDITTGAFLSRFGSGSMTGVAVRSGIGSAAAPEPSSVLLVALPAAGCAIRRRRARKLLSLAE